MVDLKVLIAVLCTVTAAPVAAQSTFVVPSGCTAFLTVQSRQCSVAHYWTCDAEPDGLFWRVSVDAEGPYYLSQSDEQYRWLQGFSLRSESQSMLLEEADPASLDDLFSNGRDDMDFTLEQTENGVTFERRYQGFDAISGATIDIDGEELLLTEFAYEYDTENGRIRVAGNQFLSADRRLFFSGLDTVFLPSGEEIQSDGSPREFIEPGEPGFLSMQPLHDCGETMSALPFDFGSPG